MWSTIVALLTVLSHAFHRRVTVEFPEVERRLAPRVRGRVILTRDPDGDERCIACNRCVVACPVGCIAIRSTKRDDGSRFPAEFRVDFARCIRCGFCEEICPTSAIQVVPDIEQSEYRRSDMIYTKEDLLIDGPGKYLGMRRSKNLDGQ